MIQGYLDINKTYKMLASTAILQNLLLYLKIYDKSEIPLYFVKTHKNIKSLSLLK